VAVILGVRDVTVVRVVEGEVVPQLVANKEEDTETVLHTVTLIEGEGDTEGLQLPLEFPRPPPPSHALH
jgi:hypothetical protein